jgi:biopolymer transport protein ExbB
MRLLYATRYLSAMMLALLLLAVPAQAQEDTTTETVTETEITVETESAPGEQDEKDSAPGEQDAPETEFERWVGLLKEGGLTIPVLLLLSIVGIAFIIERLFQLRRSAIVPRDLVGRVRPLWAKGDYEGILKVCKQSQSTLGNVIAFIVEHRNSSVSDVSVSAGDVAARDLRRHLLRAYPLAVVGTLAPLLGLLGTVSGMVDAFGQIAIAGLGDVSVLGGSISKALVTTLVGLVVAIPALFAYHFFKSRTNIFGVELEEEATELISDWMMKTDSPRKEA